MHFQPSATRNEPLPAWKRAIDIGCCLIALPFLALVALLAALITSIAAPGPIFFRQERIGYNGRRFFLYKFRTMHVRANAELHQAHFSQLMKSNVPMQKLDAQGDKRLIPGGWLLRASGLDELPQIINVLRGDMSIVGPRPCIPYEYEQYSAWERNRLNSVPGLTGLWQVSGKNRTTFEEMVQLDIAYGEKLSLLSDLRIISRTLPALWVQVSDIRNARLAAARIARDAATQSVRSTAPEAALSSTFLTNSQDVIGSALGEHRHATTRQSHEPSVSFQTRNSSASVGRHLEGGNRRA